ncbi:hypothetical protein TGCAST_244670 [Toxoplasma gondii CAST]|uniref:Uncharacterized protein n=1 Tax=Toxoplasma gondii CAST TaxID=943122 RepID=A0A425HT17_TOXGO|nr:hypothetical protein TGCAST_244670 [Toxoplasma gondii CAST]
MRRRSVPTPSCPVPAPEQPRGGVPPISVTPNLPVGKDGLVSSTEDRHASGTTERSFFTSLLQRLSTGLNSCTDARRGQDTFNELLVAESSHVDAGPCTLPPSLFGNREDIWIPPVYGSRAVGPTFSKSPESQLLESNGEIPASSNEVNTQGAGRPAVSVCAFLRREHCEFPLFFGERRACNVPSPSFASGTDSRSCLLLSGTSSSAPAFETPISHECPLACHKSERSVLLPPAPCSPPNEVSFFSDDVPNENRDFQLTSTSSSRLSARNFSGSLGPNSSTIFLSVDDDSDGPHPTVASKFSIAEASALPTVLCPLAANSFGVGVSAGIAQGSVEPPQMRWKKAESQSFPQESTASDAVRGSSSGCSPLEAGERPLTNTGSGDGMRLEESLVCHACSGWNWPCSNHQTDSKETAFDSSQSQQTRATEAGSSPARARVSGETRGNYSLETSTVFQLAFDVYQGCRATSVDDGEVSIVGDPLFRERRPKVEDLVA